MSDLQLRGVVSLGEPIIGPDGTYRSAYFADSWRILGAKEIAAAMKIDKVRLASDCDWMAVAYGDRSAAPLMVVPGCKVHGWVACSRCPTLIYDLTI